MVCLACLDTCMQWVYLQMFTVAYAIRQGFLGKASNLLNLVFDQILTKSTMLISSFLITS